MYKISCARLAESSHKQLGSSFTHSTYSVLIWEQNVTHFSLLKMIKTSKKNNNPQSSLTSAFCNMKPSDSPEREIFHHLLTEWLRDVLKMIILMHWNTDYMINVSYSLLNSAASYLVAFHLHNDTHLSWEGSFTISNCVTNKWIYWWSGSIWQPLVAL